MSDALQNEPPPVGAAPKIGRHGLPLGTPCANCATPLRGAWCYVCGQKGEEYHRSIWHLFVESLEGLTHADGRIWRTLGRLIVKPGQLTRDYLDGHRAPQIPPFRMFLVVLLAVFFTGAWNFQANHVNIRFAPADSFIARDSADRAAFKEAFDALKTKPSTRGMVERAEQAVQDPRPLLTAMEHWSHQFAILMLPIAALLLTLLFAFKRGVYVFDHLVFSMHSLAFQGLLLSVVFLVGVWDGVAALLLLLAPVHLFVHMRGTYRTSVLGTLIRMFLLFNGSVAAFAILMTGLFFVGLATAH
ncbi:MAG: DUF3667 domain-containing protein [Phenylobacterium sp.]